ncbi:hypothetical protein QUA81_18005 [Microcoleus sp. F6_B4]
MTWRIPPFKFLVILSFVLYVVEVSVLPPHDSQMNRVAIVLAVKSIGNGTLLNVLSTESSNGVGSLFDMRSWLPIIQP